MGLIGRLFGTPTEHKDEKKEAEVVKAPEFDITQYAKKLALGIPVFVGGTVAALDEFTEIEQTEALAIAAIGLTAIALLAVSLVMAVDLAARAYLAGQGSAAKKEEEKEEKGGEKRSDLIPAPAGTKAWVEGSEGPHPVLVIATDGEEATSYLVASGEQVERGAGTKAIDGAPKWYPAEKIRAISPANWP